MIKSTYLVFISIGILFVLNACKSNSSGSDSSETFELTQFIGEWERISSTSEDFTSCPENPPILEISETEIYYPFTDENGCFQNWQIMEYSFDGQKFSVDAGWDFEILSHSGGQFVWNDDFEDIEETYQIVE